MLNFGRHFTGRPGIGTGNALVNSVLRPVYFTFLMAAVLAGCVKSPVISPLANGGVVPLDQAFATPPPGGPAIIGIVETNFKNGKQQDITLANFSNTPGQNLLRVQVVGVNSDALVNGSSLSWSIPTQNEISKEIANLLPGVRMKRSSYVFQNGYGPFSYAAGRSSAGDVCLFAWQHIGKEQSRKTFFSPRGAIQIRLRLCDPGMSERDLLQKMYEISLNAAVLDWNWNPYDTRRQQPEGQLDPISPFSAEEFHGVVPARKVPVKSRPIQARRHVAVKPELPALPDAIPAALPGGKPPSEMGLEVIVPPPPSRAVEADGETKEKQKVTSKTE